MPIRTACPGHEVFTFCWALLSLALFILPPFLHLPQPSLPRSVEEDSPLEGTRDLAADQSRKREILLLEVWPCAWTEQKTSHDQRIEENWGMNRAMIDYDHTWWREREFVWAVDPTWRQTERVGVWLQPGGQGQHVPNKHGEKTINRTFTAGEKYGESWGGLLRTKIAGKWPSSSQCHWEHLCAPKFSSLRTLEREKKNVGNSILSPFLSLSFPLNSFQTKNNAVQSFSSA